jgi:ornithine carbamoyltransferase
VTKGRPYNIATIKKSNYGGNIMKHLLKMLDLSKEEILDILNLADQLKYENKNGIEHHILKGKTLGMIFQKSSTRTRVSFETGMYQLGGQALFLSNRDLQIGRGEPVQDTARVLSRYLDGIMIRTFEQKEVEDLAKYGSIPIINGLTDFCHPCQVLADLMTIREFKGRFEGLKMCYIGDGNNMANSLIVGGLKVGMEVSIACPKDYQPAAEVLEFAKGYGDKFSMTDVPLEAAKDADVLFTDVWTSMGEEAETEKRKIAFKGYQINDDIMAVAKADAMVQHCLPAHREEEITEKVFEAHANEIFEEAENRLHAQKAVMVKVMGPEE